MIYTRDCKGSTFGVSYRRSQLIAISIVDHLLVAAARLAASLTSIPATALLSGRRFVVSAVLVQVRHILPKALHRSFPQGILRTFSGRRALVASGRERSRSRWRTTSAPSPACSSASPPPPPPPPPSSPPSSSSVSYATDPSPSPSPSRYSTATSSSPSSSPSSPALFHGCHGLCFVHHVRIYIQAIITSVPLQDTIIQATFQGGVYLRKSISYATLLCLLI